MPDGSGDDWPALVDLDRLGAWMMGKVLPPEKSPMSNG